MSLATAAGSAGGLGSTPTAPPATPPPAGSERFGTLDRRDSQASTGDFDRLAAVAKRKGETRVIVGLRTMFTPEGVLSAAGAAAQHTRIAGARRRLLRSLAGAHYSVVHTYRTVPYVALRLSPGALAALQRSDRAATLEEDRPARPALAQSTRIVEATESAVPRINRTGAGQHIAVLDSGVDKDHPFLRQTSGGPSKVVAEACFSARASCPDGSTEQVGPGAGVPCTYAPEVCKHGTFVAGTAAGRGASAGTSFSGVARGAGLISVQVFSRHTGTECAGDVEDPCARLFPSDWIKGLEWVFEQRTSFAIAAANMSFGTDPFTSDCDATFPATKAAIDNLRSAGIASVAGSGNDGSKSGVIAPACVSTAITVGGTTDSDAVASFSNSSPQVELLAPGVNVNSSVPGGTFETNSGTSLATPHVSGAWAIMKGIRPAATVSTVLSHLQATGKPVTDTANSVTKPRIRVLSAGARLQDTGFKAFSSSASPGRDVASNGVGLATRAGGPSSGNITVSGIPSGATISAAYLYWMTLGGPDATAVFQGTSRTGQLVGAARNCWNVNQLGPFRVYRANLPVSAAPGNGTYTVSGVGDPPASEGEGASLVIVYSRSGQPTGRVYLREGALSADVAGETISHTFTGLSVPTAPTRVRLHVGMADGYASLSENPLRFAGTAVTPANFYDGSDGPLWDDDRITVSPSLLPVGTTSRVNSIGIPTSNGNCLTWPYAALAYG